MFRHFYPLSAQLISCTARELILSDARITFIHCQGINSVSKARGMTMSSKLLLENEVNGVLQIQQYNTAVNLYP